jgi:hypothetical protein
MGLISFTSRQYVQGLLYHSRPRFATIGAFLNRLEPAVSAFPYSSTGAAEAVRGCERVLATDATKKGFDAAFALLALEDLGVATERLNNGQLTVGLDTQSDVEARLGEAACRFAKFASSTPRMEPRPFFERSRGYHR